jgi:hypothetical protein
MSADVCGLVKSPQLIFCSLFGHPAGLAGGLRSAAERVPTQAQFGLLLLDSWRRLAVRPETS